MLPRWIDENASLKSFKEMWITVADPNINSLRNKSELLTSMIIGIVDVLVISETKLGKSCRTIEIPRYTRHFWVDHDQNGGGIMVYVSEDIP